METQIVSIDEGMDEGAQIIKSGGLVAFPTETVYGLGGNALNSDSVSKIYSAKGRPGDNPLIVHLSRVEDIEPLVKCFSNENRLIANAFMPGPITLLFPKGEMIPCEVTAGLDTVAIRIPKLESARRFIEKCGVPVAAPSANRSSHISPTEASHVYEDLNGRIPLILDGGSCEVGIESTVLDLTKDVPTILRPGAITEEMLLTVLDKVKTFSGEVLRAAPAPGMKYKHYSPKIEMAVSMYIEKLITKYDYLSSVGRNPVLLLDRDNLKSAGKRNTIDLGDTMNEVCSRIYDALHKAEEKYDYILCYDFGRVGLGGSVMNRVLKAAGGNILQ